VEEQEDEHFWDSLQLVSCKGIFRCLSLQLAIVKCSYHLINIFIVIKVASQLEVLPGAEFRVAFEEAMSYGGKVILGDRPVQVINPAMEPGYVRMKLGIGMSNF
jgi:hypothetical protein